MSRDAIVSALKRFKMNPQTTHYLNAGLSIAPPEIAEKVGGVEVRPLPETWVDPLATGEVKTLIMSDTHIPCQDESAIRAMLMQDGDADQLVWNGDIFDIDQINHFGTSRDGTLRKEYGTVLSYMIEFSLMFRQSYVLGGNHEWRITKYMRKRVHPALHFRFTDILTDLANGIQFGDATGRPTGQVDLPNVHHGGGSHYWWVQIGDCVVAHPRDFSRVPGKTAVNTFDYFDSRVEDLRAVIIGHTHFLHRLKVCERAGPPWSGVVEEDSVQATEGVLKGRKVAWTGEDWDRLTVEGGCLCKEMDYTVEGKTGYKQKRDVGYVVLYQVDGVTDFERTRYRALKRAEG